MSESIQFGTVSSADEVCEILELQADNLPAALTPETMASQGFVTVRHAPAVLRSMNEAAPAIIAKAGGRVVGYALMMPRGFAATVPILRPLFEMLDTLSWKGARLRDNPRWFVMGQICVADGYRGIGIFDGLHRTMAERYADRFDFTVTEVASRNTRSLRAHRRVGFQTLRVYPDATTGEEWHVIVLDLAECLAASRAPLADRSSGSHSPFHQTGSPRRSPLALRGHSRALAIGHDLLRRRRGHATIVERLQIGSRRPPHLSSAPSPSSSPRHPLRGP